MNDRRQFLKLFAAATLFGAVRAGASGATLGQESMTDAGTKTAVAEAISLFLCGDVMTGRGIDQALPHPSDPVLYESYVRDARDYLRLAERANGNVARPVDFAYVWGDAQAELTRQSPDLRIINLETAITAHARPAPKGINYRMHPDNIECLKILAPDCCVLANNHVLDWGREGLIETLETLEHAGLGYAGAGRDQAQAGAPRVLPVAGKGRVLVLAFGAESSGIESDWAARPHRAGVNLLPDLSATTVSRIASQVHAQKQAGDIVIASIHWGSNWGYAVPSTERAFAHALIEQAGVDLLHGHSSHHVKGLEVHRGHLIIYGCGDLLTDYEGISSYDEYRDDLGLMYFPKLDPRDGRLLELEMTPTRLRRLRIKYASADEAVWLANVLNREGRAFGTRVDPAADRCLHLRMTDRVSGDATVTMRKTQ